jgi:hypothetical protein
MEKTAAAASARVGRDRTARAFARRNPLAGAARLFNRWTTLMIALAQNPKVSAIRSERSFRKLFARP